MKLTKIFEEAQGNGYEYAKEYAKDNANPAYAIDDCFGWADDDKEEYTLTNCNEEQGEIRRIDKDGHMQEKMYDIYKHMQEKMYDVYKNNPEA
jgi:hypothetical protein